MPSFLSSCGLCQTICFVDCKSIVWIFRTPCEIQWWSRELILCRTGRFQACIKCKRFHSRASHKIRRNYPCSFDRNNVEGSATALRVHPGFCPIIANHMAEAASASSHAHSDDEDDDDTIQPSAPDTINTSSSGNYYGTFTWTVALPSVPADKDSLADISKIRQFR